MIYPWDWEWHGFEFIRRIRVIRGQTHRVGHRHPPPHNGRMATLADLNTKTNAAIAALEAGQWETAATAANAALLIIATTPDTQFDGGDQIRFDRAGATMALQQIIKTANGRRWAKSPNVIEQIRYTRG